jgi:transposase
MAEISARIKEQPDITLLEIIDEFKLPISESALCKRLIKLGLTYKKRHSTQTHKNEKTS